MSGGSFLDGMTTSTSLIYVKFEPEAAWLMNLVEIFDDILLMLSIGLGKIRLSVLATQKIGVISGSGARYGVESG